MLPYVWIHVGVGEIEICGRVCRKICPCVRTRNLKRSVTPCSTESANKASEICLPICHGSISERGRGVVYKTLILHILPKGQKISSSLSGGH
jgi:hypothetical protein